MLLKTNTINFTSASNVTSANNTDYEYLLDTIFHTLVDFNAVLCPVIVLLGVISWTFLPKWRQFRNFAFVNVSLAYGLESLMCCSFTLVELKIFVFFISVSYISVPIWQVFAAYSFYMNIVKVFSSGSNLLYLYSIVCAWVLPVASVATVSICGGVLYWKHIEMVEILSSILNLLLYLRVLYALIYCSKIRRSVPVSGHRIRIATLIFVLSGVVTYTPFFLGDRIQKRAELKALPDFFNLVLILISNVLFLMLKSHRILWIESIKQWCKRDTSVYT